MGRGRLFHCVEIKTRNEKRFGMKPVWNPFDYRMSVRFSVIFCKFVGHFAKFWNIMRGGTLFYVFVSYFRFSISPSTLPHSLPPHYGSRPRPATLHHIMDSFPDPSPSPALWIPPPYPPPPSQLDVVEPNSDEAGTKIISTTKRIFLDHRLKNIFAAKTKGMRHQGRDS